MPGRGPMKLLIFAHTPPPHHGQSYMVQLMLEGLGGDHRRNPKGATTPQGIACYHVNARLSKHLEDIGDLRVGKFILLIIYCLQAIWCRFRYGVTNLYYIPAPGKTSALYRDWLVMLFCRPFFKRIILHWHAAGLGKWLETSCQIRTRSWTYHFMQDAQVSIVLSRYNRMDAEKFWPRNVRLVGNGIPDPCPNFAKDILPLRRARVAVRKATLAGLEPEPASLAAAGAEPRIFRVLYLAHCTREKGLFDALDAIALANQKLVRSNYSVRIRLTVAGDFMNSAEQKEFQERIAMPDLQIENCELPNGSKLREAPGTGTACCVDYKGFVYGELKSRLLAESDCFCFPSYFHNENQPVNLIEAMAFGLLVITTRWRSIPELLPTKYPALVDIRAPEQIANTLLAMLGQAAGEELRDIFTRSFTMERHLSALAEALRSAEQDVTGFQPRLAVRPATT